MPNDTILLNAAPQFDVHRWSDYPEINRVIDAIFEEIKNLKSSRGERIREADKVKRHLKVVVIDLWAANKLSVNPYRAISKNKSDYQKTSRYRQIHLKYDYLIGIINDLRDLGYLKEKLGYFFDGYRKRTRIKATDKLINKILSPAYGVNELVEAKGNIAIIGSDADIEAETIILRDSKGNSVEYDDNEITNQMRENLRKINNKLAATRIILHITDQQHADLEERINGKTSSDRGAIDFTNNQLHRVFNNSSWTEGGRFYGGWWQNIPKEFRKHIEINNKPTVELDYSGHHIRILYANEGLEPPEDPYDLEDFDREDQKPAVLIMLNAADKRAALKAISSKGIRNNIKLTKAISARHAPIQHHFFTGVGLNLMYQDSILAEKVMLLMLDRGATVLPVHDSFIVRNSYSADLEEVMENVFKDIYGKTAQLKYKKTMLEEIQEQRERVGEEPTFVTDNLEELLNNYDWSREVWGEV